MILHLMLGKLLLLDIQNREHPYHIKKVISRLAYDHQSTALLLPLRRMTVCRVICCQWNLKSEDPGDQQHEWAFFHIVGWFVVLGFNAL